MRNFWMEAQIDGRKTELKGGPIAKTGGMDVTIYQREKGVSKTAVRVACEARGEMLDTKVYVDGILVGQYQTAR